VHVTKPAIQFVAPYQTVCNNFVYFFNPLGTHQSAVVPGGTTEQILAKLVDTQQENSLGSTESKRPVDIPAGQDPQAEPAKQVLHTQYAGPAVDGQGRADCQAGQTGYPFRLAAHPRYPGGHLVVDGDTPGLAGGTYKARQLGIKSLKDVP
jgi:hypothetical protein